MGWLRRKVEYGDSDHELHEAHGYFEVCQQKWLLNHRMPRNRPSFIIFIEKASIWLEIGIFDLKRVTETLSFAIFTSRWPNIYWRFVLSLYFVAPHFLHLGTIYAVSCRNTLIFLAYFIVKLFDLPRNILYLIIAIKNLPLGDIFVLGFNIVIRYTFTSSSHWISFVIVAILF